MPVFIYLTPFPSVRPSFSSSLAFRSLYFISLFSFEALCDVDQRDMDELVTMWRDAANQGHGHAQHNLGCLLEKGRCMPRSAKDAAKWHRKVTNP